MRWGTHAVEEALRAGAARALYVQADLRDRPRLRTLVAAAEARGVPVRAVPAAALDARAPQGRHQGALVEVSPFRYLELDEMLAAEWPEAPFFLVLDGVEDPHNLGAILRSADAAGVHGVLLPRHRAAAVTPAVARVSAGAVEHLAIAQVTNVVRALETLKARGVWVYGLDMDGQSSIDQADYDRPLALVAGAEGRGLGRLVRDACDLLVRIPLFGHVESLNVSVATSLALYAARLGRQRSASRSQV